MRRPRFRERFFFWLDVSKDDQLLLAEKIGELKRRRQFSGAIRDGLRLFLDLRAGHLGVLQELFPWVADALESDRDAKVYAIEAQLARLEKLLIEQGASPIALPSGGPKHLDVPQFAVPFDDEDDEIALALRPVQGSDSAQNFVNSVMAISGVGE